MTESEKAKAYDKALELAKGALEQYEKPEYKDVLPYAKADLELMFPELKVSEDEIPKEQSRRRTDYDESNRNKIQTDF